MEDRLWHLLVEMDGGPNRARIIQSLNETPDNPNKIANRLNLNYNTARFHLNTLENYGIVSSVGDSYGNDYYLTEQFYHHWDEYEAILDHLEDDIR